MFFSFSSVFFYLHVSFLFGFRSFCSESRVSSSIAESSIVLLFLARLFQKKRTTLYEDPWRVMSESSRIAVPTKGTNMIVYHRVCACMCACVRGCVACTCLDACRLDRIFLDPAF